MTAIEAALDRAVAAVEELDGSVTLRLSCMPYAVLQPPLFGRVLEPTLEHEGMIFDFAVMPVAASAP